MYLVLESGRYVGRSGQSYKLGAGQVVNLPEGELDDPGIRWIGKPRREETVETVYPNNYKPINGTVKDIKAYLDQQGISYKSNMRKAELIELINS